MGANHGSDSSNSSLCPSARADSVDGVVFGIVSGTLDEPQVYYLDKTIPINDELVQASSPVSPTEIFRIASPCLKKDCQNFDGTGCSLVKRVVQYLPETVQQISSCKIRAACAWWKEMGINACTRCPQVITDVFNPKEVDLKVALPDISE